MTAPTGTPPAAEATAATATEAPPPGLPPAVAWLFSVACGLAVANVYYSQPLLDLIAQDFGIAPATIGLVGTLTQVGYALGLLLLVPLGDHVNRRTLITSQLGLSVLALTAVALAPSAPLMFVAMAAVGVLAVLAQVVVAYAASLAAPGDQGRVVGTVTSGIVVGILLARTVAGTIGDLAGWRAVYVTSAVATAAMALAVAAAVPPERRHTAGRIGYPRLVGSVFTLFARERVLRVRAVLALLTFTSVTVLLTPMVLPLAAPPFSLSHTEIGLFGLAGAAGALGAGFAGRQADRGRAERTAGLGLLAMSVGWLPAALLSYSVWWLVLAMVVIDYGLQSVHVANQHLLYQVRPEAQSRLTAGYMLLYSAGCAAGAILSTVVYGHGGWTAVCLLGAATSLTALGYWWAAARR
ncbi:putative MFS family arabinose efflux permease [Streptomyces sp. 1114.5]|uniref:MFS transporter n=1 Tax=Streptomyces sp. 1114.5 TaxID=1938830 RepID=UPI000EAD6087|nr:MFS transporter [Streptomyces sp. 1114.5]RKT08839.1 putative MFS family arabinose efflux permease [Streptomyces sp. 1114.5]